MKTQRILWWLYVFTILAACCFYATQAYGMYLRYQYDRIERVVLK